MTAIIQPGGSIRDEMAIEVADRHHLAMVFTGRRHFRHWPATESADRPEDQPMEPLLALEMVRVTEAAAIASARFMGRGEKDEADRAAVEAMRRTMDEIDIAGTIVIGEGERDQAPMLYIGEEVGPEGRRGARGGNRDRHRRRPARGHEPGRPRPGQRDHRPGRRRTGRPAPRPRHVSREAVRRAGRRRQGRHPQEPDRELPSDRRGARPAGRGHHDRDPRATAPRRPDRRGPAAGARIKLICDGDLSAAISTAVSGTGVHAVMGIGGAPEGVITAAALRCLGGEIQARFRFRNDEERARAKRMGNDDDESRVYFTADLASGDNLVFAATGVTSGDLLDGSASSAAAPGPTRW